MKRQKNRHRHGRTKLDSEPARYARSLSRRVRAYRAATRANCSIERGRAVSSQPAQFVPHAVSFAQGGRTAPTRQPLPPAGRCPSGRTRGARTSARNSAGIAATAGRRPPPRHGAGAQRRSTSEIRHHSDDERRHPLVPMNLINWNRLFAYSMRRFRIFVATNRKERTKSLRQNRWKPSGYNFS